MRLAFLDKEVKDPWQHVGANAHAVIADAHDGVVGDPLSNDGDLAALFGVFRGVREQIRDTCAEPQRISIYQERLPRNLHIQRVPTLLDQRARRFDGLCDNITDVEGVRASAPPCLGR